jgi:molybdopterin molybdotransferase
MGHQRVIKPFVKATMKERVKKKPDRVQFLRVRFWYDGEKLFATNSGDQNTGILRTLQHANGIAVLPADREQVHTGEKVNVHLIPAVEKL